MANVNNSNNDTGRYPRWFSYAIAVILGLAFIVILFSITWNTALDNNQGQFTFDVVSLKEPIAHNVLVSNDIVDNIVAFIDSQPELSEEKFNRFSKNLLEIYPFVTTIAYFPAVKPGAIKDYNQHLQSLNGPEHSTSVLQKNKDNIPEFHLPLLYQVSRQSPLFPVSYDMASDSRYNLIMQSLMQADVGMSVASTISGGDAHNYGLFRMVMNDTQSVNPANHPKFIRGVIMVATNPAKFLGNVVVPNDVSLAFYNEIASLGRQLLYKQEAIKPADKDWIISTLNETHQVQLPSHAVKLNISRNLYWNDIEKSLVYIAVFIGFAVMLLLIALVRAKDQQASELRKRNIVIERTVKEQTRELAIARDKAVDGSRMKSEFLASMSHEIRTPLNAIIGMSELLSETRLSNEQKTYISVFRRSGDTLLSLVNDILDLSKIEAKQLSLENISFNITDVIEESVEIYALKAAEKDIELITRIEPTLDTQRMGDPSRLRQIILNLISNALKFIERGEIVVSVSTTNGNEPDKLQFSVRDTGIGIPENKLQAIFENFTQADSSTTRKYGGTGLGLSICKSLVALMQGDIWVESTEGEGSAFIFVITLPRVTKTVDEAKAFKNQLVNKRVFVAASNQMNRQVIDELLGHHGVLVQTVGTAAELLQFISVNTDSGHQLDLVVFDFVLPDMSGYQLVEALRDQDPRLRLVMMINPDDLNENMVAIKAAGIDFYLVKPVKQKELLSLVGNFSVTTETQDVAITPEADIKVTSGHKKILLVDDNADNRMLINAYLKKTHYQVDEAENGQVAVELFRDGSYDLVLMDVQMPIMDGHEASRRIRSWEIEQGYSPIPIIALTAHATREEVDKCVAAGCDSHLSKPVKKAVLLEALGNYLGG